MGIFNVITLYFYFPAKYKVEETFLGRLGFLVAGGRWRLAHDIIRALTQSGSFDSTKRVIVLFSFDSLKCMK